MTLPDIESLSFEPRLGLLIDREMTERENRRLPSRWRQARLKHHTGIEEIDDQSPRGLDKALMRQLSACQWIQESLNLNQRPHRRRQDRARLGAGAQGLPAGV